MFYSISSIKPICLKLHASGQKLVLATGFFDLLHKEHIKFLQKAKAKGDALIVGVESDARARALKGQGRPLQTQQIRLQRLAPYADYLLALPDDFDRQTAYEQLMAVIRPDIYAVSSHSPHLENKRALTKKYGGQLIIVHKHNPSVSTTKQLANTPNHV